MESVRHILIRTCMGQIQKELGHLEHWLIHLPEDAKGAATDLPAPSVPPATNATSTDIQRLVTSVEQLTKQMELQQLTLDQIIRRLAVLESVKGVHIDSDSDSHSDSPWMDDAPAPFVPETPQEEVVYIVHKTDTEAAVEAAVEVKQEEPVQDVQAVVVKKEVVKQDEVVQVIEVIEVKQEEVPVQPVEVKQEEPVQAVEVKQEEVKQEEPIQVAEVKQEQEEVEVEGEEEEEEEDVELEEISYKGEVYYRDPQQFVYSVNSEGEVSEEPIGYWKAKTKSIAFYNKK